MPHFRYHFGHPPAALIFTQNLANPQLRLARKKGAILATHGFPKTPLKFRKIMGNLSPPGGSLYRTLIEAKNAPFSASFRSSSSGRDFYPKFGQSPAAISPQKRANLETHGLPSISLKFRGVVGDLSPSGETIFRTLTAAKNAPFSVPPAILPMP